MKIQQRVIANFSSVTLLLMLCACNSGSNTDAQANPGIEGRYTCTATPTDQKLARLLKLEDPSFLFHQDGTIEYTLRTGNPASITWFGNYRTKDGYLYTDFSKAQLGKMEPRPDKMTYKYKITNMSRGGFSIEQMYNSENNSNLWLLNCSRE